MGTSASSIRTLTASPAHLCSTLTQRKVHKGRVCQQALNKQKTRWVVVNDGLALSRKPGCPSSERRSGRKVEIVGDIQHFHGPLPSNVQMASRPARDDDCSDPQPIRCKGCLQWQACGMTGATRRCPIAAGASSLSTNCSVRGSIGTGSLSVVAGPISDAPI